ncbi:hypothetical protein [Hirschia maritima]|uniref:hypothetical protein n=1 Tax=Hirschia maritima TaxID=1121961 RepID=UPI00035F028C|nr:hypothetical protein [Hirschia maritima]
MKKFIMATAVATFMSAPAFAASMTIEFATEGEDKVTLTLNKEDGSVTAGDKTGSYTWDEASKTLCGDELVDNACVTFDEIVKTAGSSTGYTRNDGAKGTATIVNVTE